MAKRLTLKKQRAIEAFLDGANVQGAAEAAQVDRRTIGRWLNEPEFLQALRGAGDTAMIAAARRLATNIDAATDAVSAILKDESAAPSIRLRAAELVYNHSPRLIEAGELMERLEALEQRLGNGGGK
jgi:hypothetical protein